MDYFFLGVLDPNDESNNTLLASHESMKPISMFRHKDGNILLCYSGKVYTYTLFLKTSTLIIYV